MTDEIPTDYPPLCQYIYYEDMAAMIDVEGQPVDQPYGVRSYGVLDPEGHQWWFVKPL
jgi:uncharacterized glyoxalase superfamily protein PhnB